MHCEIWDRCTLGFVISVSLDVVALNIGNRHDDNFAVTGGIIGWSSRQPPVPLVTAKLASRQPSLIIEQLLTTGNLSKYPLRTKMMLFRKRLLRQIYLGHVTWRVFVELLFWYSVTLMRLLVTEDRAPRSRYNMLVRDPRMSYIDLALAECILRLKWQGTSLVALIITRTPFY